MGEEFAIVRAPASHSAYVGQFWINSLKAKILWETVDNILTQLQSKMLEFYLPRSWRPPLQVIEFRLFGLQRGEGKQVVRMGWSLLHVLRWILLHINFAGLCTVHTLSQVCSNRIVSTQTLAYKLTNSKLRRWELRLTCDWSTTLQLQLNDWKAKVGCFCCLNFSKILFTSLVSPFQHYSLL